MKEKLSNLKNKKLLAVAFLFVLIALVSGLTFAIWNNSYSTNANTITSGVVSMSFTESSNVITINNALPMNDDNGKVQTDYFDFSVTSNMSLNSNDPLTDVDYEIILEPMSVDTDYTALTNSQIKVYLENKDTNDSLVGPTLISTLTDSGSNKILLSTKHTHKYGTNSITTNYRLRAWIDMNVDSSSWTSETKYEYKFRININGEVDALERVATSQSCFLYEIIEDEEDLEDYGLEEPGIMITNYGCGVSEYDSKMSNDNKEYSVTTIPNSSNDDANNYEQMKKVNFNFTGFVIKDVVIPETITVTIKQVSAAANPTEEDYQECAKWYTEIYDRYDSDDEDYDDVYQAYLNMCKGGNYDEDWSFQDQIDDINSDALGYAIQFSGIFDLGVYDVSIVSSTTYPVVGIERYSFTQTNITSIYIPSTIKFITGHLISTHGDALSSIIVDSNNKAYNDGGGSNVIIETSSNTLINGSKSSVIPNGVVTIGENAFYNCEFTSIDIPNSVTTIDDGAFLYNKLTSITIPNSVTTIGGAAFMGNELTSVVIPSSVTSISDQAFENNKLTSITIPDSVTYIGSDAFYGNNLSSVIINSGSNLTAETGIDYRAFCGNQNLTIYNNSGKAFDWNDAISGNSSDTFVTGTVPSYTYNNITYNAVNITTGSPS